ncbi:MAG: hypothetical protein ABIM18_06350 [candidate division WOR-3 bacterium]
MVMEFNEKKIILKEFVSIDEVEELFERLLKLDSVVIDISECVHIHTSILQLILLFREKIKVEGFEKFTVNL